MTRPEIIRADTIDLQDRGAPSAKHHQRVPNQPSTSNGPLAPHQAETIREVASETAEENLHSPRVSWPSRDVGELHRYAEDLVAAGQSNLAPQQSAHNAGMSATQAAQHQDALAIAQNGSLSNQEADNSDMEGDDDGLDDDMLDKISSSPSIEDGGLPSISQALWPPRSDSLHQPMSPLSIATSDTRSSSPYLEDPEYLPLQPLHLPPQREAKESVELPHRRHHLPSGEYNMQDRPNPDDEPSSSPPSALSKDVPYKERTARVSVLQEVVAEMYRMEQEGMARPLEAIPEEEEPMEGFQNRSTRLPEGQEEGMDWEEVEDEGIADIEGSESDTDSDDTTIHYDDLTLPYEGYMDHDDDDDFSDVEDARFIDSGWGGDCLQDAEDIDFEFVYALHTFVATVEGQANATKGDTMVLLDDSNSYWWLVRVVKDSSIGYLPAEHIETPTERLARLNKHRNIDLSATMLGDQAEKTKNPLKSAIKRRQKKTVTFNSSHQYHDYSDFDDYSSEEDDLESEYLARKQQEQQAGTQQASVEPDMDDETAKVEPLKPRSQQEANGDTAASTARSQGRTSEEIFETKSGDGPKKTSDGTVRDSFFKDDTVETKKITLTPNLLRDDNAPRSSGDSKELKQRPSLDKLEKDNPFREDKKKKDKKEKDKKPGAFRSLFSRKDKKKGSIDDDDESFGKRSLETDAQEKESHEEELVSSPEKPTGPQRNPSKLKKPQPRAEPSPNSAANGPHPKESGMGLSSFLASETKVNNVANVPPSTMRAIDPFQDLNSSPETSPQRPSRDQSPETARLGQVPKSSAFQSASGGPQPRPQEVVQAKSRSVLDDSDSDDAEGALAPAPARPALVPEEAQKQQSFRPQLPGAFPDSYTSTQSTQSNQSTQSHSSDQTERGMPTDLTPQQQQQQQQPRERLSESPIQISPVNSNNPPPLVGDSSSQEEGQSSDRETPSPDLLERDDGNTDGQQDTIATTSAATAATWNDASLRAFFDSGSDVRDMLVVVYDKTDVMPAGPEHPVAGSLFKEQNAKLAEITTQLDNMLGDWLARKQRMRGTV